MPRHWLGAAITVLLLSAVGCDRQSPGAPSFSTDVPRPNDGPVAASGRVVDFSTNASVAGAVVAFGTIDNGPFVALGTATTDATGVYIVPTIAQSPGSQPLYVEVDGVFVGLARLTGAGYRGDLFVHPGTCVARYGIVADGLTLRPVSGATVKLLGSSAITAIDGWYRLDLGCPADGRVGFNTTFLTVTHPDYVDGSEVVGRGVSSVARRDVWLARRSASHR